MLSKNQVKNINNLHLKKFRAKTGQFIAEGPKVVDEFLHADIKIVEIYAVEEWIERNITVLMQKNSRYFAISEAELTKISALQTPNEVLAVCEQPEYSLSGINKKADVFLYLDGVADPGNMGTILRVAEWFGLNQVFCSENSADIYNPKVVQSTMGSLARLKVFYLPLSALQDKLEISNTWGAVLDGDNLYQSALPARFLLVIGSESHGIDNENLKLLSKKVTIPKAPGVKTESLNAATAASVLLSEIFRRKQS